VDMSPLVRKAAGLMMDGLYEPGQYVRSAHLRAGELHDDGQGGAWFCAETDENSTDAERVRVTVTPETARAQADTETLDRIAAILRSPEPPEGSGDPFEAIVDLVGMSGRATEPYETGES
jgi:hypothetical protein